MGVGTYCLTSRAEAKSYLGNMPDADGFWIYCSVAATSATVEVTATTIVLIITGGTSASSNTISLTAGGATDALTELVDAINLLAAPALTYPWKAGLIYNGSADSTDLVVTGALSCLLAANEITLKIEQNYLIDKLCDRATDFIEKYCNRKFKARNYTLERYTPIGMDKFFVENYPIINIIRITEGILDVLKVKYTSTTANNAYARVTSTGIVVGVDGTEQTEEPFTDHTTLSTMATAIDAIAGWDASVASSDYNGYPSSLIFQQTRYALNADTYLQIPDEPISDYEFDTNTGIIYLPGGLGEQFRNLFISYRGGYETIPDSLEMACLELVKYKYHLLSHDPTLRAEGLGDYNYTLADLKNGLTADLIEELAYYKRRIIL